MHLFRIARLSSCNNRRRLGHISAISKHHKPSRNLGGGPDFKSFMPAKVIPPRRGIPNVNRIVAISSAKGGVGKSTVAVNLAMALASHTTRPRVGILDLDIFGPSIPKLMGLENIEDISLSPGGKLLPPSNHNLRAMSISFLLPPSSRAANAVIWRGLMVQKATQQLLFDVDWSPGLDVLVVDLPPGTGDVQLTLAQLVKIDGVVVVSTPQEVALADVKKGVDMFRKTGVPILGVLLNMSHYICDTCATPHYLFGSTDAFHTTAKELDLRVLGELPLVPHISAASDRGTPFMLTGLNLAGPNAKEVQKAMREAAEAVLGALSMDSPNK